MTTQRPDDFEFSNATKQAFADAVRSLPDEWMSHAVLIARIRAHVGVSDDVAMTLFSFARIMGYIEEKESSDGKVLFRKASKTSKEV